MLHLYRIVLVLTLFTLSSFSHAKDKLVIIGCHDKQGSLCNNVDQQRDYAFYLARKDTPSALVGTNSAKLDYIIQSDFSNTVTHFKFSVLKDYEIVEGPDGRDMYLPVNRLQIIRQDSLSGSVREEVLNLVSIKRGTENLANELDIPLTSDGTIDYDSTCGTADATIGEDRSPALMALNCKKYLTYQGIFLDSGTDITFTKTSMHDIDVNVNAEGSFLRIAKAEASVNGSYNYQDVQSYTIKWGNVMDFTTTDGYWITLKPNENGRVDVTSFVVPPNIEVPVELDGQIILEGLEDRLLSGDYDFNVNNERFISMLAARMQSVRISRLAVLLERGFKCIGCTGKIVDELTEELGGGQSQ